MTPAPASANQNRRVRNAGASQSPTVRAGATSPLANLSSNPAIGDEALTPEDYRALGEFRRAIRQFLAFSEHGAKAYGLTSQQHQALLAIKAHPGPDPISIGDLADSLMIKNHSAVELVARLVEHDLVARRDSEADRRRVVLELQPKGAEALEIISRRNLARLNDGADILSDIIVAARRAARPSR
jgi:DNA-binding MarR family transcriptional regulator